MTPGSAFCQLLLAADYFIWSYFTVPDCFHLQRIQIIGSPSPSVLLTPSVDQQKVFLTEIQRTSIHIYDRTQRNALSERHRSE